MLLIVHPEAPPESLIISDYEDVYGPMPDTKAEIVCVEQNEVTKMVFLKGVSGTTFEQHGKVCPAWMALEAALADDPKVLYDAILMALEPE